MTDLPEAGRRNRPGGAWPWVLAGVWAVADQVGKAVVSARILPHQGVEVIPGLFRLVHVRNRGVAFGLLDYGSPWQLALLVAIALAVIVVLGFWLARLGPGKKATRLALALILGGALGNLVDRVRLGYVVDFIDLHWWNVYHYPAFNIADIGITLGAGLLILLLIREERSARGDRLRM